MLREILFEEPSMMPFGANSGAKSASGTSCIAAARERIAVRDGLLATGPVT